MITDELLRTEREGKSIDEFLKKVEHSQGRIVVFSTEFEPGKKLESLGRYSRTFTFPGESMSIESAAIDIRYLLDRGFPQKGAVGFACDHYKLDSDSRHLLSRAVISKSVCEKRHLKFLPCDKIRGNKIIIDGYNIIIGMESILEKKAIMCDDGVIRDIKGVSRNFCTSENTT